MKETTQRATPMIPHARPIFARLDPPPVPRDGLRAATSLHQPQPVAQVGRQLPIVGVVLPSLVRSGIERRAEGRHGAESVGQTVD